MLKNYFKIAWRSFRANKWASFLNITGLSLGMAAALLILLWVQNELNFDNYHPAARRIFHLAIGHKAEPAKFGGTPFMLANAAQQEIPGIEKTARVMVANNGNTKILGINNNFYKEKNLVYVDKNWFNIFQYDFVDGNAKVFTENPYSIIITEPLAKKYYGSKDAVGQLIHIDSNNYRVQAVVKENPSNSSFQFSIFLPMETLNVKPADASSWLSFNFQTFVQLRDRTGAAAVEQQLNRILLQQEQLRSISFADGKTDTIAAALTSLPAMHFSSNITDLQLQHGDKNTVTIFSILGLLLLTIACINYVNLSTARASLRSKEVSVKKMMGASRQGLFAQFMTESLLTGFIALMITLLIVKLSLPWFNGFTEKNFVISVFNPGTWKIALFTLLITVVLTGVYPALLLSSFKPLNVLKGISILKVKSNGLRKTLVVSQFTVAVALTICTIVILQQLYFIRNNNEGYDRKQIFSVSLPASWNANRKEVKKIDFVNLVKNELSEQTVISNVTVSNDAIQNLRMSMGGIADWQGKQPNVDPLITPLSVDADFRDIFKLELKEGRWFEQGSLADRHNYILNETAVAEMGLQKPVIGQYFAVFGDTGRVIGVVKDFHFRDYHNKINSSVLMNNPDMKGTFFIQATPANMKRALAATEATWRKLFPQAPFEYSFMDEAFAQMYQSDLKTSKLVGLFSGVAIFISCLGLFGLVSFIAEQRTKEIGIRKVLGATVANITLLLSKDFVQLVILAILIASPIAWWAVSKWLEAFVYRINISAWIFVLAGIGAIGIALLTVCFRAIRAAIANPVKSLRTE